MLRALRSVLFSISCLMLSNMAQAKSDIKWIPNFTIKSHDTVKLKAQLWEPSFSEFPGKRPAVIFINSWGLNKNQYDGPARILAKKGYVVLSYATRGFGGSEGTVKVAGDEDIKDISTVIDWLVENTRTNPEKIASAGISYGGGVSLIASAKDDRIKAVIAMSSWTDLEQSLYPNETLNKIWIEFLIALGRVTGNLDPKVMSIYRNAKNRTEIDELRRWAKKRSALTYIDEINNNQPAIYMSQNYKDQLFSINQSIHFFDKLTTPKKLIAHKGIHASAEIKGLFGLNSNVWNPVYEWLDHWLLDQENGLEEGIIEYTSTNSDTRHIENNQNNRGDDLTPIELDPINKRRRSVKTNSIIINSEKDSRAETGIPMLSAIFESHLGTRVKHNFKDTRTEHGAMYQSAKMKNAVSLNGIPKIEMYFNSYYSDTQVVAYLYDIPKRGKASLISHGVASFHQLEGEIVKADFELHATSYELEKGHRFGLIIDTGDALYLKPSDEVFSYSIIESEKLQTKILLPL